MGDLLASFVVHVHLSQQAQKLLSAFVSTGCLNYSDLLSESTCMTELWGIYQKSMLAFCQEHEELNADDETPALRESLDSAAAKSTAHVGTWLSSLLKPEEFNLLASDLAELKNAIHGAFLRAHRMSLRAKGGSGSRSGFIEDEWGSGKK